MQPKISIIIPVYNTEKYLHECLNSVVSQTIKDVEIICIDDGSTDNSYQILQEYAEKDSRFVILQQENKGAGAARNKGIEIAKGEFLVFLDSDDYYLDTDVLESLYESAQKNDVLICGGGFAELQQDGTIFSQWENTKEYGFYFDSDKLIEYQDYQFDYGFTRFIYKRTFLLENNIFFSNRKHFEDPTFFVKAMFTAKKFYAIKKIVYWYRINYKKNTWNINKINDLLDGILENMVFSKNHNLEILNEVTALRFLNDYSLDIVPYYRDNSVQQKISDFSKLILKQSLVFKIINDYFTIKDELLSVRQSLSFKIGKKIMFLPCFIKELFKKK